MSQTTDKQAVTIWSAYQILHNAYPMVTLNTTRMLFKSRELSVSHDGIPQTDIQRVLLSWKEQAEIHAKLSPLALHIQGAIARHRSPNGLLTVDRVKTWLGQSCPDSKAFHDAWQELVDVGVLEWIPCQGYRFRGTR